MPLRLSAAAGGGLLPAEREDAVKRLSRGFALFRERAKVLRDAVCRLLGWHVDVHFASAAAAPADGDGHAPAVEVQLRSVYAASAGDYLSFRMAGESLELLDSPAAAGIKPANFAYLSISRSFPAFLAQTVIDGLDATTQGLTGGGDVTTQG